MPQPNPVPRDEQTHAIIGAAMEVHRELGRGSWNRFIKAIFVEFAARGIPFEREVLPVYYKGQKLPCFYVPDFVCYESVIVELKALKALTSVEEAIILNYLKATPLERGLLLNFGSPSLEFKRFIFSHARKQSQQSPIDPD